MGGGKLSGGQYVSDRGGLTPRLLDCLNGTNHLSLSQRKKRELVERKRGRNELSQIAEGKGYRVSHLLEELY